MLEIPYKKNWVIRINFLGGRLKTLVFFRLHYIDPVPINSLMSNKSILRRNSEIVVGFFLSQKVLYSYNINLLKYCYLTLFSHISDYWQFTEHKWCTLFCLSIFKLLNAVKSLKANK